MSYIGMKELEQVPVIPSKDQKGPLSYDNCKKCVSKCEHAGKDRPFCYRDKSCKVTVATNADRIRAMSDEELAEFICGVFDDDDDDICGKFINGCFIPCYDQYSIKEWLQQPADEVK